MSTELKPCPFCGCDKIAVSSALNYGRSIYKFHCWKCGAVSGCSETKEGAVRLWNRRTTEDELKTEVERLKGEVADAEKDKEIERLKAELNNALMILKQIDWLYSEENERARIWDLKVGGLSPTEWMGDIVRKSRDFIANAPDTIDGNKEASE